MEEWPSVGNIQNNILFCHKARKLSNINGSYQNKNKNKNKKKKQRKNKKKPNGQRKEKNN